MRHCESPGKMPVEILNDVNKIDRHIFLQCPRAEVQEWCWDVIALYVEYDKGHYFFEGKPLDQQPYWYPVFMNLIGSVRNQKLKNDTKES